jgi:hypothetical protein
MNPRWAKRFELLLYFLWMGLGGALLCLIGLISSGDIRLFLLIFGALFFVPGAIYGYFVTIWHWKDRYRGNHSDLWGAIILIETSGWMKIVYLFRHILPDMRGTGHYRLRRESAEAAPVQYP